MTILLNESNTMSMKKNLLLLFVLTFIVGLSAASAQVCTPDPQYTEPGVYPDSATNLAPAGVGVPYAETVTVIVPVDTTVEIVPGFPQTLSMDSIVITGVTGLPPGFTYDCAAVGCAFLGGTTSCLVITGTAQAGDEGTYNLTVELDAYVGGTGVPVPSTVSYYYIDVLTALSIDGLTGTEFKVSQNKPNPFNNTTLISYTAAKSGKMDLTVVNMLGDVVYQRQLSAKAGENNFQLSAANLEQGVYLYRLSNGEHTITKRMIVNR